MKKFLLTILAAATLCSTVSFGGCAEAAEPAAKLPAASESLVLTETENDDIALMSDTIPVEDYETYGVAETVEIAKTLTATLSPAYAADKRVDYTAQWVNADSTWATGKTVSDYVTITQETDGALTALLTCKQAFGEQIKVTVSARSNPSAQATCTLDYAKRIKYATVNLCVGSMTAYSFNGDKDSMTWSYTNAYDEDVYYYGDSLYVYASYTDGTIEDSFSNVNVSIKAADWFKPIDYETCELSYTLSGFGKSNVLVVDKPLFYGNCLPMIADIVSVYEWGDLMDEQKVALRGYCYKELSENPSSYFLTITVSAEGQYSSYEHTLKVYADVSTLPAVESVDVEPTSFVF